LKGSVQSSLTPLGKTRDRGEYLDKSAGGSKQHTGYGYPVLVEVAIEPSPEQQSNETTDRNRERQLNHRLSLRQVAEWTFAATPPRLLAVPCSIIRHSSTIKSRGTPPGHIRLHPPLY
jgi:hypothetical protein